MQRRLVSGLAGGTVLTATLVFAAVAADPAESKSALEQDASGWIDLLADKDLKDWNRVPIPPGSKLNAKNPWSWNAASGTLVCDGVGVHEMLLQKEELGDGIFHVEWRFKKVEGKSGYNSGVYARNSADGKIWHQAQVGNKNVGFIFGNTLVGGEAKRVSIKGKGAQRGKEAGEWNTFEITCKGKSMSLWVNGAVTLEWPDCEVPRGHVGMEAEGWWIEFRNVKYRKAR